jgi:hypothetical protein
MIVCFLHAKVGHCQAIYTKPSPHGLQKTLPVRVLLFGGAETEYAVEGSLNKPYSKQAVAKYALSGKTRVCKQRCVSKGV